MKKILGLYTLLFLANHSVNAASQHVLWGAPLASFPAIQHTTPLSRHSVNTKKKHERYQLTYQGIPIWGHQLIIHRKPGSTPFVTGVNVTGIEADVASLQGKLNAADVLRNLLASVHGTIKFKKIKKVIYLDDQQKAHLAYHVSLYITHPSLPLSAQNDIVDANTGEILKQWDNVHHERVGQGMGGNAFALPYRAGSFQYGDALPGLMSLGKFDVQIKEGSCSVENSSIRVMSLENAVLGEDSFPVSVADESEKNLHAFSYTCGAGNQYVNYADGANGPIHYAFSPINDTMFFAESTLEMYTQFYGVKEPLGDDLPLRAFTHLGGMDNAFAIPTIIEDGQLLAHQQIVVGNGAEILTAPSQAIIGHELSHNFTEINAGLIYEGQSGGINEAFSDMAAIALQDYLRVSYPWYWDGEDWTIGREATIGGEPLRYLDDPTKDGSSIKHAGDYNDELDVHASSGVFNRAFYLLAHQSGWTVRKAFQVMVDANQNYWQPNATFNFAACGVIQAAVDRGLDKEPVVRSFAEVGVTCEQTLVNYPIEM